MPPAAADVGFTNSDIKALATALRHLGSFSPDWKAVNNELGVKNAARDCRKALKKLGLKLESGKIMADDDEDTAGQAPKTPKKTNTNGAAKAKGSSVKKRKINAEAEDDESGVKEEKKLKLEEDGEGVDDA